MPSFTFFFHHSYPFIWVIMNEISWFRSMSFHFSLFLFRKSIALWIYFLHCLLRQESRTLIGSRKICWWFSWQVAGWLFSKPCQKGQHLLSIISPRTFLRTWTEGNWDIVA
jgi:hypothetical protein